MDKSADLAAHLAAGLVVHGINAEEGTIQSALETILGGLGVTRKVVWALPGRPDGTPNKIETTLIFSRDQTPEELAAGIAEAERRFAISTWGPKDGPPPEGASQDQILDQGVWWMPKEGAPVKLADMAPSHRKNTLAWLERRSATLKFNAETDFLRSMPSNPSDMVADSLDHEMTVLQDQPVVDWFNDLKLVKALRKLIAADEA